MSKRRVNNKQFARIQKIQADYQEQTHFDESCQEGLVITRFGRDALVESADEQVTRCAIRPHLDSIVAGDRVVWQAGQAETGVIVSCYPRQSVLERADKRGENKAIAANITQLMIVVASKPELSWLLLDSYLVMAENLQLKATIVLNKIDIATDELRKELCLTYESLGYNLLFISKHMPETYELLHEALNNQTSVFVGQSGVGKSSLIAGILPNETDIQTAAISEQSELGCHTTRNSRFYHLPRGGALIDSPGVREFGLWQMPKEDIVYGFRELRRLAQECRFRNCDHRISKDCALIRAVNSGQITECRYHNLIYLLYPKFAD